MATVNLASLAEQHPADRRALISRGKVTTWGELQEQAAALRGGLTRLGLEPGDRVAVICANNWYFVVSYLAILGSGLVAVPLNPASPTPALERELATVGAKAVIVGPSARGRLEAGDAANVPELEHVVFAQGTQIEGVEGLLFDDLMVGEPAPIVERAHDDLAALLFTSGTGGAPKAAMLTHGNLLANLEQTQSQEARQLRADDLAFAVLPFFHIFGLNVALGGAIYSGSALLLVERFDPTSALEAIAKHGATVLVGPPTLWHALATLPDADGEAMKTIRIATSGASKLPTEVAEGMQRRYGVKLHEGYGLTETSPVVASSVGTDAPLGSIGRPVQGVEVRLVDLDGEDVLVGDAGEVWVRGPNVFKGYWLDEVATADAMTEDGWLRTGDLAVVTDDGYLMLVDRAKDLIIVSGFNVYPAEVEEVLMEHPAIARAAVVGVAHPHTGEAVKAYVVPAEGMAIEEDDVIAWCEARLPRYKCPQKVNFVDELPEGIGGKVLRRILR
jgi:long-chain acyl-CoA synthetase